MDHAAWNGVIINQSNEAITPFDKKGMLSWLPQKKIRKEKQKQENNLCCYVYTILDSFS